MSRRACRAPPVRGKDRVHLKAHRRYGSTEPPSRPTPADHGHSSRRLVMPVRRLPVRPDLEQLKHQAKELLTAIRAREPEALADLAAHHPKPIDPAAAKLADAQLVLARSYQVPSWNRLVQACNLIDAIWRDDPEAVRALVTSNPKLLHESA